VNLVRRRNLNADFLLDWIAGHSREPSPDSMPKFKQLTEEERLELADWLLKLDKPIVQAPSATISAQTTEPPAAFTANCALCHGPHGEGNIGPPLTGISLKPNRSGESLLKLLDNPRAYGLKDPMPASFTGVTQDDKRAIVEWLERLNSR
jgi:mono/diheme cytochrome c family protein